MRTGVAHFVAGYSRFGAVVGALVLAVFLTMAAVMGEARGEGAAPVAVVAMVEDGPVNTATGVAAPTTVPTTNPAAPASVLEVLPEWGPDVVLMDQLHKVEGLYDPVPFDHKGHAHMAQIQGGCTVCHHRSPEAPETREAGGNGHATKNQNEAGKHPACRTCHEVKRNDVRVPGLKGAYHQQCLNCHREWMHENACVICHKPVNEKGTGKLPTPEDVLGRMHEPVKEPEVKTFRARFMPADGANVSFRHKEHTERFGFACVTCHRERDSCGSCHGSEEDRQKRKVAKAAIDRDWHETHQRCVSCHKRQEQTCNHCHYKDGQEPPAAFEHAMTGQLLDANHAALKCVQCHGDRGARAVRGQPVKMPPTCGGAACHKADPGIAFPTRRPGPVVEKTAKASVKKSDGSVVKVGGSGGGGR